MPFCYRHSLSLALGLCFLTTEIVLDEDTAVWPLSTDLIDKFFFSTFMISLEENYINKLMVSIVSELKLLMSLINGSVPDGPQGSWERCSV